MYTYIYIFKWLDCHSTIKPREKTQFIKKKENEEEEV
jgi:hypothetical protein